MYGAITAIASSPTGCTIYRRLSSGLRQICQSHADLGLPHSRQARLNLQLYSLDRLETGAQSILASIRRNQQTLQEAHERSKTVTRSDEMKEIREKMQDDIDEVNKTAHQVKNRLECLDKLNEQALGRSVGLAFLAPLMKSNS